MIVIKRTLDEIKAKRPYIHHNTMTENDKHLIDYYGEEEFYVDGDYRRFLCVDEVEEYVEYADMTSYLLDEKMIDDFIDSSLKVLIKEDIVRGRGIFFDSASLRQYVFEFVNNDITHFLEWLWKREDTTEKSKTK